MGDTTYLTGSFSFNDFADFTNYLDGSDQKNSTTTVAAKIVEKTQSPNGSFNFSLNEIAYATSDSAPIYKHPLGNTSQRVIDYVPQSPSVPIEQDITDVLNNLDAQQYLPSAATTIPQTPLQLNQLARQLIESVLNSQPQISTNNQLSDDEMDVFVVEQTSQQNKTIAKEKDSLFKKPAAKPLTKSQQRKRKADKITPPPPPPTTMENTNNTKIAIPVLPPVNTQIFVDTPNNLSNAYPLQFHLQTQPALINVNKRYLKCGDIYTGKPFFNLFVTGSSDSSNVDPVVEIGYIASNTNNLATYSESKYVKYSIISSTEDAQNNSFLLSIRIEVNNIGIKHENIWLHIWLKHRVNGTILSEKVKTTSFRMISNVSQLPKIRELCAPVIHQIVPFHPDSLIKNERIVVLADHLSKANTSVLIDGVPAEIELLDESKHCLVFKMPDLRQLYPTTYGKFSNGKLAATLKNLEIQNISNDKSQVFAGTYSAWDDLEETDDTYRSRQSTSQDSDYTLSDESTINVLSDDSIQVELIPNIVDSEETTPSPSKKTKTHESTLPPTVEEPTQSKSNVTPASSTVEDENLLELEASLSFSVMHSTSFSEDNKTVTQKKHVEVRKHGTFTVEELETILMQ